VLETVKGGHCLLEVVEVVEMMCCVLLCMLEAVEGGVLFAGDGVRSMRSGIALRLAGRSSSKVWRYGEALDVVVSKIWG
jgi:hypothetical protein